MTLVSLSSLGQYPTTKKIKGQQVVIMTVKQAEEVNSKFEKLEDSLNVLNDSINILNGDLNGAITSLNFTHNKLETTSVNLNQTIDSLVKIDRAYHNEVKKIEKFEWIEKRTRVRLGLGIGAMLVTWVLIVVSTLGS
jgi:hypothetical protein